MRAIVLIVIVSLLSSSSGCDEGVDGDPCDGECDAGLARCEGDVVQTCEVQEGCLRWVDTEVCSHCDVCYEWGGEASCQFESVDGCSWPSSRCADGASEAIERCRSDGCSNWWEVDEDCAESGQLCDDSRGEVLCVLPCQEGVSELRAESFWTQFFLSCPVEPRCPAEFGVFQAELYHGALRQLLDDLEIEVEGLLVEGCLVDCLADHPEASECHEADCTTSEGAVIRYHRRAEGEAPTTVTLTLDAALPPGLAGWTALELTAESSSASGDGFWEQITFDLSWEGVIDEQLPAGGTLEGEVTIDRSDWCGYPRGRLSAEACELSLEEHDDGEECSGPGCLRRQISLNGRTLTLTNPPSDDIACGDVRYGAVDGECLGEVDSEMRVVGPCPDEG